jgi:hypothetical protein
VRVSVREGTEEGADRADDGVGDRGPKKTVSTPEAEADASAAADASSSDDASRSGEVASASTSAPTDATPVERRAATWLKIKLAHAARSASARAERTSARRRRAGLHGDEEEEEKREPRRPPRLRGFVTATKCSAGVGRGTEAEEAEEAEEDEEDGGARACEGDAAGAWRGEGEPSVSAPAQASGTRARAASSIGATRLLPGPRARRVLAADPPYGLPAAAEAGLGTGGGDGSSGERAGRRSVGDAFAGE